MNVSAVSSVANYQALQQASATSQQAAVRQAVSGAAGSPDGDGDHGVEPQSTGSGKTGQILNALA